MPQLNLYTYLSQATWLIIIRGGNPPPYGNNEEREEKKEIRKEIKGDR